MLRHRLVLGSSGTGNDGVLSRCERSWSTWLTYKKLGTTEDRQRWTHELGLHTVDPHRWQTRTGSNTAARWRLTEDLDTGRWTSTLTAVELPAPARVAAGITGWVELTVESEGVADQESEETPAVFLPRIHRYLMTLDGWSDGPAPLTGIQTVERKQVPYLVQVLTDPRRRLPAFVLSTPPTRMDEWQSAAEMLAARTRGLGSVWLLDRDATHALQERLGKDLGVWGGAARTYLPQVRPNDASETGQTSRHRVVSWEKLTSRPEYFTSLLAYRAAELAVALPLPTSPSAALDVIPVASRHLKALKASQVIAVPAISTEIPDLQAQLATLAARLAEALAELDSTREEYSTALSLASGAEQEKSAALIQARSLAAENAALAEEAVEAEAQMRGLRQALRYTEDPILAESEAERVDPGDLYPAPDTFADLIDLLQGDVQGVQFTGDPKRTRALDRHANRRAWLTKAWDAVLAMANYAEAVRQGTFNGLFTQWCDGGAPAAGRILPVGPGRALIPSESGTVKQDDRMAAQRLLPVPTSVEPGGRAYMWSHVRIGGGGSDAPRLHFVEAGPCVYIGFLGQHLDNTLTN